MPRKERALTETTLLGADTQIWKVSAGECPSLANRQIAHVAVANAAAPFEMVRMDLSGTYMMACFGGSGRILMDGRWQALKSGWATIAPPHVVLAFHADPGKIWDIVWVRYQQPPDQKPVMSSSSPALAKFSPEPLRHAVMGLWHEVNARTAPSSLAHWVEVIHYYVASFARPWQMDDRLGSLWEQVAVRLSEDWTLERLTALCHMSSEHLRRICRREMGRSPMHHVIYLRMQFAAKILAETDEKVEVVANRVGYKNAFVFSNTFKKWVGWRPSEYRSKHRP
jgi:AraC-like DNA-binding protein